MPDAQLIDGKAVAAGLRQHVAEAVAGLQARHKVRAGLATILVGDDPASAIYIRSKARACEAVGISSFEHRLPASTAAVEIRELIDRLNADERTDGILLQLPLPSSISAPELLCAIDPQKDVDGFHPLNIGRLWSGERGLIPCTPQGVMLLLRAAGVELAGAEAVVIGRSSIVGRPLAALLLAADCTVTILHSKTRDPATLCRRADILIAALGAPQTVTAEWVKPGATVVDVGINRRAGSARQIVGDVDFAAVYPIARAITPVPGGVGPMTIACLLRNTVLAACRRRNLPNPPQLAD